MEYPCWEDGVPKKCEFAIPLIHLKTRGDFENEIFSFSSKWFLSTDGLWNRIFFFENIKRIGMVSKVLYFVCFGNTMWRHQWLEYTGEWKYFNFGTKRERCELIIKAVSEKLMLLIFSYWRHKENPSIVYPSFVIWLIFVPRGGWESSYRSNLMESCLGTSLGTRSLSVYPKSSPILWNPKCWRN